MIYLEGRKMTRDLILRLRVNPKDVAFITKIFEGYDGLAIATTINGKKGLVNLNFTPETEQDVLDVLDNFPKKIEILY